MVLQIGAVLSLSMCYTEGGAWHTQKSNVIDIVQSIAVNMSKKDRFTFLGAIWPISYLGAPHAAVAASTGGFLGVLHHFEDSIHGGYFKQG